MYRSPVCAGGVGLACNWMTAMDEARITAIAQALCRSARIDPDSILPPETEPEYPGSMSPAVQPIPAWERFRGAAQNYCESPLTFRRCETVRCATSLEMYAGGLIVFEPTILVEGTRDRLGR